MTTILMAACDPGHPLGLRTTIAAGPGNRPPAVDVTLNDPQGLVQSLSPADPVDTPNAVDVVPGSNNAYRVTWLTNPCETRSDLSIRWVGVVLGIGLRSSPGTDCSQVGIRRQVVIVLKEFVPSTQMSLTEEP